MSVDYVLLVSFQVAMVGERESQYRDKDGVVLELCRTKIEKLAVDEIKKKKNLTKKPYRWV